MSHPRVDAAVLVPVLEDARGTSLVFIVRTDHGPHGGQVAFPGGVREPRDATFEETALREFEEELGVARSILEVTETLPPMPTLTTGFRVTPVVARLARAPEWIPDPREVREVLQVPVSVLRDPANRGEITWDEEPYPCIHAADHSVWGLTYRILERVLPRLPGPSGRSTGAG